MLMLLVKPIFILYLVFFFSINYINAFFPNSIQKVQLKKTRLYSLPNLSLIKQLQLKFSCDEVDADEISELLLEVNLIIKIYQLIIYIQIIIWLIQVGTLSVSCEVESVKNETLQVEKNWLDLQKQKNWFIKIVKYYFYDYYIYLVLY